MFLPLSGFSLHAEWLAAAPEGPPRYCSGGWAGPHSWSRLTHLPAWHGQRHIPAAHVDARGLAQRLPGRAGRKPRRNAGGPAQAGSVHTQHADSASRTACRVGASTVTSGHTWVLQSLVTCPGHPLCVSHALSRAYGRAVTQGHRGPAGLRDRTREQQSWGLLGARVPAEPVDTKRRPRACDEGPWAGRHRWALFWTRKTHPFFLVFFFLSVLHLSSTLCHHCGAWNAPKSIFPK